MSTYRIAATVPLNGLLELSALPFQAGELVEVTVRRLPISNGQTQHSAETKQQEVTRTKALEAIQSGKYAKVLRVGESLASAEFALQKQGEQAQ